MVIKRDDVFGNKKPKSQTPQLTQEQSDALDLLVAIDSGMTLTRFQVEAASDVTPGVAPYDVDNMIKTAVFALCNIETTDSDSDKLTGLAIALEAITIAVDALDTDLEDVAKKVLNELR